MSPLEIVSFEYAVSVINELATSNNSSFMPFEIIWNTSLGPAKARTVIYNEYDSPVINESTRYGTVKQKPYNPNHKETDSFSFIRYEVFHYFDGNGFGTKNLHLLSRPDLLMVELLEICKVKLPNNIETPNYKTIFDFELLDGTTKLPFILSDSIEIKEPISLVSKN